MKSLQLEQAKILFVDDENDILNSLKRLTRNLDAKCLFADSGIEGLDLLEQNKIDIVVSDMKMPEMTGVEFLAKVASLYPETIRIVLTGHAEQNLVVDVINEGRVWGFLLKPWQNDHLLMTLNQALITRNLLLERLLLQRALDKYEQFDKPRFEGFIGDSPEMQVVYHTIDSVAPSNASVFISGSSGTGKEVAAQAIHNCSKRAEKPFIALNCAAIPKDLIESEVFGHIKGAFSGAVQNRDGAATLAHGGTLFLDELAEMDIALQAKLLRFIQTGTFQKVGSSKTETVDIRFICATNKDPLKAIQSGELREDLYYRLNVISIDMPDLKERGWDTVMLADHFLQIFSKEENKIFTGFTDSAERLLVNYDWPGNVRQLQNAMNSVAILSPGPLVTGADLASMLKIDASDLEAYQNKPLPFPRYSQPALDAPAESGENDNVRMIHDHRNEGAYAIAASDGQTALAEETNYQPARPLRTEIKALSVMEREIVERAIEQCGGNVVNAAKLLDVSPSTLYRKIEKWDA